MPETSSYKGYYQRAIEAHNVGLKLVVGGTGLGKTYGAIETIAELPEGKKAVYVANRLELLVGFGKDVLPEVVVTLSRDVAVVFQVFRDHSYALKTFLESDLVNAY